MRYSALIKHVDVRVMAASVTVNVIATMYIIMSFITAHFSFMATCAIVSFKTMHVVGLTGQVVSMVAHVVGSFLTAHVVGSFMTAHVVVSFMTAHVVGSLMAAHVATAVTY